MKGLNGFSYLPMAAVVALVAAHSTAAHAQEITIVLSEEPDLLEPCQSSRSNIGRVVKQNVVETLTEIDPKDGSITPRLATEWSQIDDLTWRFEIRQGVTFHDGAPLDAESVAFAINRTMDTNLDCEVRTKFFGGLTVTPTAVDTYTLEVATDSPVPILPTMMGTVTVMSPNTPMGVPDRTPVGTGPYRFVSWDVGENIVLERSPDYWGGQPDVAKATYVWRSESAVRAAMVATGEADIAPNIAVQDATDEAMDFSYPNSETTRMRIDTLLPPLDDVRVREAINLAIDRDAMRGTILSKDVIPATQLVVPSINGHNPDLKVWPYDPAKARELLDAARGDGVDVDSEITMIGRLGIYPNATEVAEAMTAMLQDAGLNVKLQMLEVAEWVDFLTKPFAEDRPPVLQQSQHDNNNGDAVFTAYNKYHSEGAQSTLSDPEVDDLLVRAGAATGDERRSLFQQAFKRVNQDLIADVPMYHMVGYTRVGPRITFTPSISTNSELQIAQIKVN
ncbi:MAG: ABC transporter substrate-binding protein [Alphaproteobacteria bacterium]